MRLCPGTSHRGYKCINSHLKGEKPKHMTRKAVVFLDVLVDCDEDIFDLCMIGVYFVFSMSCTLSKSTEAHQL